MSRYFKITELWINADLDKVALQTNGYGFVIIDPTITPSDQITLEHEFVEALKGDGWTLLIPEHTEGGIDHACCVALEQA